MQTSPDLSQGPPRSPRVRLGGYAVLARTIDKCRASIACHIGAYHFNCPLDEQLFKFIGVKAVDFYLQIDAGATDEEMVAWVDKMGQARLPSEIAEWSDQMEATNPYYEGERRSWFIQRCRPLKLDPTRTTMFDWLEADDRESFRKLVH